MSNFDFLKKIQQLQKDIMIDKLIDFGFAALSYCNTDTSEFWNNALTNQLLIDNQISLVEEKFHELNRKSTFYFENKTDLEILTQKLSDNGYKKSFQDSWQFWKGAEVDNKYFEFARKVNTDQELKIFLETFDKCYQKGDPQNPYGELGDYLKVAEQSWRKHHASNRLEYFIVYKSDQPVAVSTLTNFLGIGYLSNVGSLREVRGEGYGKAATHYCVQQSFQNGNKEHCLATEEGHYPNDFYKRIGFATRFNAVGLTKD